MLIVLVGTLITTAIGLGKYYPVQLVIIILICALNLYTIYMSKEIVLNKRGKEEQEKLLELKKYIEIFGLMEKRDLESVVIWDKYLAYATAFGIASNVTNSIYEKWYNLNLTLQVIEKII